MAITEKIMQYLILLFFVADLRMSGCMGPNMLSLEISRAEFDNSSPSLETYMLMLLWLFEFLEAFRASVDAILILSKLIIIEIK